MDTIPALLGLVGLSVLSQAVAAIGSLFGLLISFICHRCVADNFDEIRKLNHLFTKRGWRQIHALKTAMSPVEGWCILFVEFGCIIGYKSSQKREQKGDDIRYDLYIFGENTYRWLRGKLMGKPDLITVEYIHLPNIWRCDINTTHLIMDKKPTPWQDEIVQRILHGYQKQKRFSLLVHGPPGVGKSLVAYILNREMAKQSQRTDIMQKPTTVICDPTKRGLTVGNLIAGHAKESPVILLFNEYDTIVKKAESPPKEGKSDGISLADSRTSFLDFLDQLQNTQYVILIATMNPDSESIPLAYRRPGRIDLVYAVPGDVKPFE